MGKTKEYTSGDFTVVWKPDICIHSGNCVKGSPGVFNPSEKPWIQLDNADTEAVMKTIDTCPSGALSYYRKGKEENVSNEGHDITKIEVLANGPLLVLGTVSITHEDGRQEEKLKRTTFCRCGKSDNKPFCDGSHNS